MLKKPMTEEQLDQWIAALRSGEYEQGKGTLRTSSGYYCCLGVANKVCGLNAHEDKAFIRDEDYDIQVFLPIPTQSRLARMNDNNESFVQIADYLEEHRYQLLSLAKAAAE